MYKTTSILALGLFLSLAPQAAFAQTQSDEELQIQQDTTGETTQDQTTQSGDTEAQGETVIEQQATDEPESMDSEQQATDAPATMDSEQQATDAPATMDTEQQATDEPATMDTEQQAEQDEPADSQQVLSGQISEQEEGSHLASDLMGEDVLSPEGESIGTISDLILTEDGRLQGVIVGVGGFLGIGEKRVAIGMGSIEMRPSIDSPDELEIVSDQTREQLEEGTGFRTLADVRAEEEAAQAEQQAQQAQPPAPAPAD